MTIDRLGAARSICDCVYETVAQVETRDFASLLTYRTKLDMGGLNKSLYAVQVITNYYTLNGERLVWLRAVG
jgi:hypothetical protein